VGGAAKATTVRIKRRAITSKRPAPPRRMNLCIRVMVGYAPFQFVDASTISPPCEEVVNVGGSLR
jgi:hypothetical protein